MKRLIDEKLVNWKTSQEKLLKLLSEPEPTLSETRNYKQIFEIQ